jgi:hypothetical protein
MRTLTPHEKRTIRIAAAVLGAGLIIVFGQRAWTFVDKQRTDYRKLVKESDAIRAEIKPYQARVAAISNLMARFNMDPAKLTKASIVADASAAIQKAAASGGLQLGPIRESAARASSKELAVMQLEAIGQVTAILTFLHRLEAVGFPLIVDSIQLTQDASKPGMVKLSLTITILDFEQWKQEVAPNV